MPANWWNAYGLPTPEREYRFHPKRRWRFDFAWPPQKVAVEIEGGVWNYGRHTRGSGFLADMDKYNMAGALGWRVFRFTPDQFNKGDVYTYLEKILKKEK